MIKEDIDKYTKYLTKIRINVTCDICGITYNSNIANIKRHRLKYTNDLCRSCKLKFQYKNGTRHSHFAEYNKSITGLSYAERFGEDKAKQLKDNLSQLNNGKNNNNYGGVYSGSRIIKKGKTYDEIYGIEKSTIIKNKLSKNTSGKNNPMYGKPSPIGSGNGWSGWYKKIYFRSLLELSYLFYLLDNKILFENGELKKHSIKYKMNGIDRTYYPDFYLIDSKTIVEIKPKKLINTAINKCKFAAANKKYNKFTILTEDDIIQLSFKEIYKLYINNEIIFLARYKTKMDNYTNVNKDKL